MRLGVLIRRRYGGECICRLPLLALADQEGQEATSTETCDKCGKQRKVFEDDVEFGIGRAEVCWTISAVYSSNECLGIVEGEVMKNIATLSRS